MEKLCNRIWLFDCDGVILQSNHIKTQAMYQVALHFSSPPIASAFKQYHQRNAGKTRFVKFDYFFSHMLKRTDYENDYNLALTLFAKQCTEKLIESSLTEGIEQFITALPKDELKIIVSAGTQKELQYVFNQKNISHWFSEIRGGPCSKTEIIDNIKARNPSAKYIFFGDAKADYMVSKAFDIDFVFVSDYSEFDDWPTFFKDKEGVSVINNFSDVSVRNSFLVSYGQ